MPSDSRNKMQAKHGPDIVLKLTFAWDIVRVCGGGLKDLHAPRVQQFIGLNREGVEDKEGISTLKDTQY